MSLYLAPLKDHISSIKLLLQKVHTEIIHLLSIAYTPPFESEYQSLIHSIQDDVPFIHNHHEYSLLGESLYS
ncbi:hypothetical protein [Candidatus Phycorickettsia trachydisci]|uniref:hypothetical protein n=1 Tax=Candidatus Phycorickettsia trachydisci TaxID=2115978 RepID=UPI00131A56CE|nr:hypothetical protein [Candidatus Phycorickettsia trachydisci]